MRNLLFRHDRRTAPMPMTRTREHDQRRGEHQVVPPDLVHRVAADVGQAEHPAHDPLAQVAADVDEHREQPDAAPEQRRGGVEAVPRAVDVLAPRRICRSRHGPTVPRAAPRPVPTRASRSSAASASGRPGRVTSESPRR